MVSVRASLKMDSFSKQDSDFNNLATAPADDPLGIVMRLPGYSQSIFQFRITEYSINTKMEKTRVIPPASL